MDVHTPNCSHEPAINPNHVWTETGQTPPWPPKERISREGHHVSTWRSGRSHSPQLKPPQREWCLAGTMSSMILPDLGHLVQLLHSSARQNPKKDNRPARKNLGLMVLSFSLDRLTASYTSQALGFDSDCMQEPVVFQHRSPKRDQHGDFREGFFLRSREISSIYPSKVLSDCDINQKTMVLASHSVKKQKQTWPLKASGEGSTPEKKTTGTLCSNHKTPSFVPYSVFHKYWPCFNVEQPRAACMTSASLTQSFNQLQIKFQRQTITRYKV